MQRNLVKYIKGKKYEAWGHQFTRKHCLGSCEYVGQEKLMVQYHHRSEIKNMDKFVTSEGVIIYDGDFNIKGEGL